MVLQFLSQTLIVSVQVSVRKRVVGVHVDGPNVVEKLYDLFASISAKNPKSTAIQAPDGTTSNILQQILVVEVALTTVVTVTKLAVSKSSRLNSELNGLQVSKVDS